MNRRMILAGLAAALPLVLGSSLADAAEKVRIGYSIAKTGLFSQAAPSQITAYELWAEQVNAAGGLDVAGEKRPVELVWYDDESDPGKSAQIYEKLITSDKVDLLLAPWGTPMHLAIAGILEKYAFPVVGNTAASVAIREVKPGNLWFTTSAIPDKIGPELAKMMKQAGVTKAAIISNVLPFSAENLQFLLPALEKEGIAVAVNESYPPDIKDMSGLLGKIKESGADGVVALSYPNDSFLMMGQLKESGVAAPFMFMLVGPTIPAFGQAFGEAANGIVTIGHWSQFQSKWPKAKPFYDAYVAKYGSGPDYLDTALAYMSCEILQQAVGKAGLDKDKLRAEIGGGTFDTINGPVKFNGVENASTPTAFLQMQADGMHLVWPADIATSQYKAR